MGRLIDTEMFKPKQPRANLFNLILSKPPNPDSTGNMDLTLLQGF